MQQRLGELADHVIIELQSFEFLQLGQVDDRLQLGRIQRQELGLGKTVKELFVFVGDVANVHVVQDQIHVFCLFTFHCRRFSLGLLS